MTRLKDELRVIPKAAVALGLATAVLVLTLFFVLFDDEPPALRLTFGLIAATILLVYILLVGYVYGDATRRGMRPVLWALVGAFVPNAIGFIAYFILREPVLQPCASCGTPARRDFAFCPQCGSPLPRVCPSCQRPVETSWTHCAHCGARLSPELSQASPATTAAPEAPGTER